jgi:predicted Zn-dependent protease
MSRAFFGRIETAAQYRKTRPRGKTGPAGIAFAGGPGKIAPLLSAMRIAVDLRSWRRGWGRAALALLTTLALGSPARADDKLFEQEAREIVDDFGGIYDDPAINAYVASVGKRVVETTPMAGQPFTFTILDNPVENAFSLPGGRVFLTRGVLALVANEAELAGVIGHEIGHVTSHHTEHRMRRAALAQLGVGLAALLGARLGTAKVGLAVERVAGVSGLYLIERYSREQEFQADILGTRSLSAAGYDPHAMATFLGTLEAETRLENAIAGRAVDDVRFSIFADHPRTPDRIARATREADKLAPSGNLARDAYLERIEGMLYGDNPDQGVVRDGGFYHPVLRFAFDVPRGFEVQNTESKVVVENADNAGFILDKASDPMDRPPGRYISEVWAPEAKEFPERFSVNGMAAATIGTREKNDAGDLIDLRLVAIRYEPRTIYRFLFVFPSKDREATAKTFERVTGSFRRLEAAEAARFRPYRLHIVTVQPGDTVDSLAKQMPFEALRRDRFLILNALPGDARLVPGQKVKLVTE